MPRVLILPRGGSTVLKDWRGKEALNPANWRQFCLDCVSWVQCRRIESAEIFLCLIGDEFVHHHDSDWLAQLLSLARQHSWGTPVYIVASSRLYAKREMVDEKDALREWLETALAGRALDFLQIRYEPLEPDSIQATELQKAACRARQKQKILQKSASHGPWHCVFPETEDPNEDELSSLLHPLVQYPDSPGQGVSLLILAGRFKQAAALQSARSRYPGLQCLIVTHKARPSPELLRYCSENHIGDPIYARGDFELWYLLVRLNSVLSAVQVERIDSADAVVLDPSPAFEFIQRSIKPKVLLTSAFDPDEPEQCREAAHDIGSLLKQTPLELDYLVHPAVTRSGLIRHVNNTRDLNVWVHMGHGHMVQGIQEAVTGSYAAPKQWLQCFDHCKLELALVLFLTCHSAEAARLFAQAGAAVAVGFENAVESDTARMVAVPILKAISKGMDVSAILQGFARGRSSLTAVDRVDFSPRAFYPVRL